MGFEKGNEFWRVRATNGRDKLFETPDLLWLAAVEYFEWCDNNPLYECKAFAFQGMVTTENLPKMRAYTIDGLCLFLDCSPNYFRAFKSQERENKEAYLEVIERIERAIYNQKFTGAAADLLNPNIISRELGLVDNSKLDHTTKGESLNKPKDLSRLTDEELKQMAAIQRKINAE